MARSEHRCVCGHPRSEHTHLRQGTDCCRDKCPRFRRWWPWR